MDNNISFQKENLLKLFEGSCVAQTNYLRRIRETKDLYNREITLIIEKIQEMMNNGFVIVIRATGKGHKLWLENNNLSKIFEKYGIVRVICKNLENEALFKVSYDYKEKSENGILIPIFLPPIGIIEDVQIFDNEEDAKLFCEVNNTL